MDRYIYIPGPSLSRIIFDLCGFSGAGLKITFGLGVMDSMTQFCCQKVGLSRLFCVILGHIFGPSQIKSAIVRLSPPFNPGIFGGGKARNFWEIFRLTTWNILYPPTFFWFRKNVGGVLRMPHFSPEMVWHTLSFCVKRARVFYTPTLFLFGPF